LKKIEWLESLGYDIAAHRLTEEQAREICKPLSDPGTEKMKCIRRIVVHHSATESGSAELFRLLHREVNGWNDIGYHFVIGNGTDSGDGEIEKGRELPYRGAHAKGANEDSIGICLVGNFNQGKPSAAQMNSLRKLLLKLMSEYGTVVDGITLHKLVKGSSTECPGAFLTLSDVMLLLE